MNNADNLQRAAVVLLRECFEGMPEGQKGTWFVERREAIFDALDAVDAAQASRALGHGVSSVAAHALHVVYALQAAASQIGEPEPEGTWEDSWKKQSVTESEWAQTKDRIRGLYAKVLAWLETNDDWSDESTALGALAVLPHMAFHLGALRQLVRLAS